MAYKYNSSLTPFDQLRKNFKGLKLIRLNDPHLIRGVIIEQERIDDAPEKAIKETPKPLKEGFQYRPCLEAIMEKGTRQDIRVKPSRTTGNNWASHVERVIKEYINEINDLTNSEDEVL